MVAAYYDYYETADGRYLSVGSLEPQFMQGLGTSFRFTDTLSKKGASLDPQERYASETRHSGQN